MMPAVFVKDKVFTGLHHGDAFSKLTEDDKNCQDLLSGFFDNDKFITDDKVIYLKDIIILRHAQSDLRVEDGPITPNGRSQAFRSALFLKSLCLNGYTGFCSPYLRCKQTSDIIKGICSIPFEIDMHLSKQTPCESCQEFQSRIQETLDILPKKSVLITHCDFIQKILTHLIKENLKFIANCSITYIHQNKLIFLAKEG